MIEHVADQGPDVAIGEAVVHIPPVPAPRHQIFLQQHAQTLGCRRHLRLRVRSDLRNLLLACEQQLKDPQPSRVATGTQHARRPFDHGVGA